MFGTVVAVAFLKCFFVLKYIKMMFFYFFKIIFEINASKRSKTYQKNLIFSQKNEF